MLLPAIQSNRLPRVGSALHVLVWGAPWRRIWGVLHVLVCRMVLFFWTISISITLYNKWVRPRAAAVRYGTSRAFPNRVHEAQHILWMTLPVEGGASGGGA